MMNVLVYEKSNKVFCFEAKRIGGRRWSYNFKEEESQLSCNKVEMFYEIVNFVLKEQYNK